MTKNYLDILAETIRNNWEHPALTDFYLTEDGSAQDTSRGNHYTYGEMYAEIVRVADLLKNLGLQKGDHIAICGANSSHWVIAYLAIIKIQGVVVDIMHSSTANQIAQMEDFADAKAILVDNGTYAKLRDSAMSQVQCMISLEDWSIKRGRGIKVRKFSDIKIEDVNFMGIQPEDPWLICFTSGSTGTPKAVVLPYRTISSNTAFLIKSLPDLPTRQEHALIFLPLEHVLGILLLTSLFLGCHTNVLIDNSSAISLFKSILMVKPYIIVLVPLLATYLLQKSNEKILLEMKNYVRYFLIGGAQVPQAIIDDLRLIEIPISLGYGLTETGAMTGLSGPNSYRRGAVGLVSETTIIRIASNGEILVKGENVMLGYYKDPEATAQKIDADGWLHTGDKGHLDEDGYLYVEGRLEQDIIVLPNGENIRPDNIESLINALPEVKESIVLARDGKLVAIVVSDQQPEVSLRRVILRTINPQLPLFSQLYDVEITDHPLARTEKQTLKRYLYS